MLTISPNALEFAEMSLIITAAARFHANLIKLSRFPSFVAPALIFCADYYYFLETLDIDNLRDYRSDSKELQLEEMHLDVRSPRQRVLVFTAAPSGFCAGARMHINSRDIVLLYDVECMFGSYAQQKRAMTAAHAEHHIRAYYYHVLQVSERYTALYSNQIRKLNEEAIDAENYLFAYQKKLLLELQNRTQFVHTFLQAQKLQFYRQAQRAEKLLCMLQQNVLEDETIYTSADQAYATHYRLAEASRLEHAGEPGAYYTENYAVQMYIEKTAEFSYKFYVNAATTIAYNFDVFRERYFAATPVEKHLKDFQDYLCSQYTLLQPPRDITQKDNVFTYNIRYYIEEQLSLQIKKVLTSQQSTTDAKEKYPIASLNNYDAGLNDAYDKTKPADVTAAGTDLQSDSYQPGTSPHSILQLSYTNPVSEQIKPLLYAYTIASAKPRQIKNKAKAVYRKFPQLARYNSPDTHGKNVELSLALACYHFAKYTFQSVKCVELQRIKQFNADAMLIVLTSNELLAMILIVSNKATLYYDNQYFVEASDVKIEGIKILCSAFELRGKMLKPAGKAIVKFETGQVYRVL